MSFAFLLALIFALYFATTLLLLLGTFVSTSRERSPQKDTPSVSVLIAARNEELRIRTCIESLLQSEYSREKFEILIIDDRSTDRTLEIAREYERLHSNVRAIPVTKMLAGMSGKASTICQGIDHARGELMLVTDADCIVQPGWMAAMARHFESSVGLVGGFTLLSPISSVKHLLNAGFKDRQAAKVQTLDWMYLLTVGVGAAGLGKPVSILGNNFGFRRKAYDQVGGYRAMGFSIIEDFALMQKLLKETDWQVKFPLDHQTCIFSFPPSTWKQFLDQRRRWAAGGKEVGFFAKYLMILAFARHLAIILSGMVSWQLFLAGIASTFIVDFAMLLHAGIALKRRDLLKHFFLFELYYFVHSFAFAPTVALPTTVHWKGINYRMGVSGKIRRVDER